MSPVDEWEKLEYLVQTGQHGEMVHYSNKSKALNRRDVINNAEALGPLLLHVGASSSF